MPRFVVKIASAQMPNSCKGIYRKVAVLEMARGCHDEEPTMISDRARNVNRVVKLWDKLNVGKTEHSAYYRALGEAKDMATKLNELERYIPRT